jgi:hypothetical protein
MSELEKQAEWVRYYQASHLKMNALHSVLKNDGEGMLDRVLKKLGLASASDVVKASKDDWTRFG